MPKPAPNQPTPFNPRAFHSSPIEGYEMTMVEQVLPAQEIIRYVKPDEIQHPPIVPVTAPFALLSIWRHPRLVLTFLAWRGGWSWSLPIGLALLCFYLHFFIRIFLGEPLSELTLVSGALRILIGWLLSVFCLYLLSRLAGGQLTLSPLLTTVAWATLPLTVRSLIEMIYMLGAGQMVAYPGLSGLLVEGGIDWSQTDVFLIIMHHLLGKVDLYTMGYVCLLVVAVSISSRLSTMRSTFAVGVYLVVVSVLGSLMVL